MISVNSREDKLNERDTGGNKITVELVTNGSIELCESDIEKITPKTCTRRFPGSRASTLLSESTAIAWGSLSSPGPSPRRP